MKVGDMIRFPPVSLLLPSSRPFSDTAHFNFRLADSMGFLYDEEPTQWEKQNPLSPTLAPSTPVRYSSSLWGFSKEDDVPRQTTFQPYAALYDAATHGGVAAGIGLITSAFEVIATYTLITLSDVDFQRSDDRMQELRINTALWESSLAPDISSAFLVRPLTQVRLSRTHRLSNTQVSESSLTRSPRSRRPIFASLEIGRIAL